MCDYTRQQVQEIYEEYCHLDMESLFVVVQQELDVCLGIVYSRREDTLSRLFSIQKELKNHVDELNIVLVGKQHGYIHCDEIISLAKQYQGIFTEFNRSSVALQFLHNNNSVDDFLLSCYFFFQQLPKKFSVLLNPNSYSQQKILELLMSLAPILAEEYLGKNLVAAVVIILWILSYKDVNNPNASSNIEATIKNRRPPMDFYEMGIFYGAVLVWKNNPSIIVNVISNRSVVYDSEEMVLSRVTAILKESAQKYVYPGPHWLFEGRMLKDIYDETYP